MTQRHYKQLPNPRETYSSVIKSLLPIDKLTGKKAPKLDKNSLPEATYTVDKLKINKTNLQDYRRICGFADNGQVPPTYYAVLSQALQMNMMVNEDFPFAMLGLVHIENSVTQYRRIADTEVVRMEVSFANLRDHDKGKQFDFDTKVYHDEELIWAGTSTYLSRQKTNGSKKEGDKKNKPTSQKPTPTDDDLHYIFAVPEDIGRRYAKISGDFNLIHLSAVTAKAFGFPRAIAHGMWSKAKCLSVMDLPDAYTVDVAFKLPIYLPSEVELIGDNSRQLSEEGKSDFGLYSTKDDKPHLAGYINIIDSK